MLTLFPNERITISQSQADKATNTETQYFPKQPSHFTSMISLLPSSPPYLHQAV
jgi:hypothetical protein